MSERKASLNHPTAASTPEKVSSPDRPGRSPLEAGPEKNFFVVGIGASAGGLEALEKFFSHTKADSGLAFVIIQHLSPDYKSLMAQLLSKHTSMPVLEAEDGLEVKPDMVYLIPPKKNMTIFHYRLHLTDREVELGLHLPIDIFFKSLAEDLEEKAIAVILSGTGSDGTRGIRAIKENGGMIMVQEEKTAKFDGMPRSAIATQLVDYILPPEQMVRELINYIRHPCLAMDSTAKPSIPTDEQTLDKVFAVLRSRSGVDFTYYKQNTVIRRIERRMSVNQIQSLEDYLKFLYRSTMEVDSLYKELLIGVTHFFRDEEAFEFVEEKVIPAIFAEKQRRDQVRVWVSGCSTGEEAYSLAILLREYMEERGQFIDVKVFATDIDQEALEFASRGVYPESIAAEVSQKRLQNYFAKKGDSYEVQRAIRELVIFARQDLIKDPPFSKIDLVACRNVLIYLQPSLQKKVISIFQFALRPDGFLFLGSSETVSDKANVFFSQNNKWKIYQYKGGLVSTVSHTNPASFIEDKPRPRPPVRYSGRSQDTGHSINETLYRHLIEAFLPACAIVNESGELLHVFGEISHYLQIRSGGAFTANILKMVRQDLSIALNTAIHKAAKNQKEVIYKNVTLQSDTETRAIDLITQPFTEPKSRQKLIFIQFVPARQAAVDDGDIVEQQYDMDKNANQRITDLEQELQYTKENLQATIEELETSNEELQATNEELLASNEELQSTNEELQSVNEELITVNTEFQAKITELTELNNDMNNTDIATVFVDNELRVRKFTPAVQHNINLMEFDISRPIKHISHNFRDCNLAEEARAVLQSLTRTEREVYNSGGQCYLMKIHPYRTEDNVTRGVVITFIDVTPMKEIQNKLQKTEAALREQQQFMQKVADASPNILYVYDLEKQRHVYINREIASILGYNIIEIQQFDNPMQELMHPDDLARYPEQLDRLERSRGGEVVEFTYRMRHKDGHWRWLQSRQLVFKRDAEGQMLQILGAAQDVTSVKQMEREEEVVEEVEEEVAKEGEERSRSAS